MRDRSCATCASGSRAGMRTARSAAGLATRTAVRVYSRRVRIGAVAERAGVSVETLRYYERRGLLPEPARTPGGHRDYGEEAVRFVRAVKDAQSVGLSLAETEEYVRLARRDPQ